LIDYLVDSNAFRNHVIQLNAFIFGTPFVGRAYDNAQVRGKHTRGSSATRPGGSGVRRGLVHIAVVAPFVA